MSITVFDAETELASRLGGWLGLVGKNATVTNGTASAVYLGSLREGMASLRLTPMSFSAITDADLAQVSDRSVSQLLDVAELRLLQSIYTSFTQVDQTISMGSQSFNQRGQRMKDRIDTLAAMVKLKYGYGLGSLSTGTISIESDSPRDEMAGRRRWCGGDFF